MVLSRWPGIAESTIGTMPTPSHAEEPLPDDKFPVIGEATASDEEALWPKVYQTTRLRWGQMIFPQQLILDEWHIVTRKRHFPLFWITREESIPWSKLGAVKLTRGLLWSTVEIENTGGVNPIIFPGLSNRHANEVRRIVEQQTSR